MALEAATQKFVGQSSSRKHVKLHSAVEIDKRCQQVLGATFGHCCFSDITKLDYAKKTAFCVTHGTWCKLKSDDDEGVSSLATTV